MSVVIDGTTGISGNDGSAATPALRGEDANTGVFFPAADTVAVATGGVQRATFSSSGMNVTTTVTATNALNVVGSGPYVSLDSDTYGSVLFNMFSGVNGQGSFTAYKSDNTDGSFLFESPVRFGFNTTFPAGGTATTPTISFNLTPTTGIYSPSVSIVAITNNGTERLRVAAAGQIGIGGANYGTSGQVLTSGGSGAAPSWADAPAPTTAQVGAATAGLASGAVGTYAWLGRPSTGTFVAGTTYAGSGLRYAGTLSASVFSDNTAADVNGATPAGTWMAMGSALIAANRIATTIFLRIS